MYEATLPAVAPLIALATWKAYPDRVEALGMLREVARSEDVRVWHFGVDGEVVQDERREREVRGALLEAVQQHADELLGTWREVVAGEELDEEQEDRLDELEAWIEASDENG